MNRRTALKAMAAGLAAFILPAPRRQIDLRPPASPPSTIPQDELERADADAADLARDLSDRFMDVAESMKTNPKNLIELVWRDAGLPRVRPLPASVGDLTNEQLSKLVTAAEAYAAKLPATQGA